MMRSDEDGGGLDVGNEVRIAQQVLPTLRLQIAGEDDLEHPVLDDDHHAQVVGGVDLAGLIRIPVPTGLHRPQIRLREVGRKGFAGLGVASQLA